MVIGRREKILVGVSILVFGGAWMLTSSPSPKPTGEGPSQNAKQVTVATVTELTTLAEHLKQTPTLEKNDPFMPISQTQVSDGQAAAESASFTLQGIFSDAKGRAAVINGKIVYEGEEIAPGLSLQEVTSTEVTIKRVDGEERVGFKL